MHLGNYQAWAFGWFELEWRTSVSDSRGSCAPCHQAGLQRLHKHMQVSGKCSSAVLQLIVCAHIQVSRLGVCSILVRTSTGVSLDELKRALDQFARQK